MGPFPETDCGVDDDGDREPRSSMPYLFAAYITVGVAGAVLFGVGVAVYAHPLISVLVIVTFLLGTQVRTAARFFDDTFHLRHLMHRGP